MSRLHKHWTDEERDRLKAIYRGGWNISRIARDLGRTVYACKAQLSKLGLSMRHKKNSEVVRVYLTYDEFTHAKKEAARRNVKLSAFLRQLLKREIGDPK